MTRSTSATSIAGNISNSTNVYFWKEASTNQTPDPLVNLRWYVVEFESDAGSAVQQGVYETSATSDYTTDISIETLQDIQNKADLIIIEKIDQLIADKQEETNRLIDQKILGMQKHYNKRRKHAQKMKAKVSDPDVIRMREAQIINIDKDEAAKKLELEAQKKVSGSYQILSVMEVVK